MIQQDYHNILVRAVNWIGDAVMSTPALMAVRETYPKARITLLANQLVGQLLQGHPAIDQVLVFDRKKEHHGLAGRLRLAHKLKNEQFDLAIVLPNSFDSALIPWLARIPQRWGKASDGRSLLLTKRYYAADSQTGPHEVAYYLGLLAEFNIHGSVASPCLSTSAEEDLTAVDFLARHGISSGDVLLGVNAGASFGSAKRWYPERFGEVAKQLAAAWGARIILFGGPDETAIVAEIEQALQGNCLNMAGKTSVRQLMALIKRCNFFITNDSGPMHIAAAFGVPVVAIFGPTDHKGTSPCSDKAVIVRQAVDCAPCKLRSCPTDHRCMTAVSADDVVQAALQLIKTTTRIV